MRWVKVFSDLKTARENLVADKPRLLIIGDTRICIIMRKDKIYAVSDRCSHNGESLSKGSVNFAGEIVCPWHGYQFNLQTGREWQERSADLVTFPVREDADGLYIGI